MDAVIKPGHDGFGRCGGLVLRDGPLALLRMTVGGWWLVVGRCGEMGPGIKSRDDAECFDMLLPHILMSSRT